MAVLDTNFWLATHVTAITVGYSAGMLAAALGELLPRRSRPSASAARSASFYAGLGRMVYGVLCFGVIFSTVGTILGGIWANDSWGRFWGWDPKENGALLIVLSQLVILHARMGGYLKEHGVCAAAALGGTVVAFSWFGVNLLGVGPAQLRLHQRHPQRAVDLLRHPVGHRPAGDLRLVSRAHARAPEGRGPAPDPLADPAGGQGPGRRPERRHDLSGRLKIGPRGGRRPPPTGERTRSQRVPTTLHPSEQA